METKSGQSMADVDGKKQPKDVSTVVVFRTESNSEPLRARRLTHCFYAALDVQFTNQNLKNGKHFLKYQNLKLYVENEYKHRR